MAFEQSGQQQMWSMLHFKLLPVVIVLKALAWAAQASECGRARVNPQEDLSQLSSPPVGL